MKSPHTLSYCTHCDTEMVRCATCGNYGCNGGSGYVDGPRCPDCPDSWVAQDAYYADPTSVEFAVDERDAARLVPSWWATNVVGGVMVSKKT